MDGKHDANGSAGPRLAQPFRAALDHDDSDLLKDLETGNPALRRLLLGHKTDTEVWPAGTLYLSRSPRGLRVSIRVPGLSVVANYTFERWSDMWETLENDLELQLVPWEKDYKEKEKEMRALRESL